MRRCLGPARHRRDVRSANCRSMSRSRDVIHLCAGDLVPADLRLISAKDLFVNQASLTGEALPVEKSVDPDGNPVPPGFQLDTTPTLVDHDILPDPAKFQRAAASIRAARSPNRAARSRHR
jgi:magnesium-transporting ATPase (P-type)